MSVADAAVCVVIVTHNSGDVLPRCLASLRAQAEVPFELIVVDNGSTLPPEPQQGIHRLLVNPGNPGFAVACNQGAAASTAPWLLFLNPDCFPGPDDLARLLAIAKMHPGCGLLGAQLLEADGREQPASRRHDPTPARLLGALRWGRDTLEPESTSACSNAAWESVEAVSGALMLMPRNVFEQLGGFDSGYRLHFEDLDLCRRVRAAGYSVGLAPAVRVTHLKGTSSRRRPLWVAWQKHRGLRRYFERFDAKSLRWPARQGFRLLLWLGLPALLVLSLRHRPTPGIRP